MTHHPYAGLLRRAAAYLLDVTLLAIAVQVSQWGLRLLAGEALPPLTTGPQIEFFVLLTVSLPIWLYFSVSESTIGQTLGKRWLSLRVTRETGGRPHFGQALLRTVIKLLPWELTHLTLLLPTPIWSDPQPGFRWGFVAVYALLGLYAACIALTPRRQGLHDLLAGTFVLRTRIPQTLKA